MIDEIVMIIITGIMLVIGNILSFGGLDWILTLYVMAILIAVSIYGIEKSIDIGAKILDKSDKKHWVNHDISINRGK